MVDFTGMLQIGEMGNAPPAEFSAPAYGSK
jgi:hypothetical protein